jgi:hypothetical protein
MTEFSTKTTTTTTTSTTTTATSVENARKSARQSRQSMMRQSNDGDAVAAFRARQPTAVIFDVSFLFVDVLKKCCKFKNFFFSLSTIRFNMLVELVISILLNIILIYINIM